MFTSNSEAAKCRCIAECSVVGIAVAADVIVTVHLASLDVNLDGRPLVERLGLRFCVCSVNNIIERILHAIDNIEIIQNSCPAPNVSVNSITSDTIVLEWTPGGNETSWLVSLDSFAIEVYDTSYTFDSLTPNTEYDIEVRAICGPGDTSLAVPINVRTACGPFALPFYEDFDSWSSTAADPLPACWYKKTNYSTNYPYASTSQNHTPGGSKSMYMYSTASTWSYMVLPQFAAPLSSLQIHFWLRKASASHRLFVGVITDPNDETTFQAIDTVSPSALSVWEEFVIPFSNYTGSAQYIAIMSPNGESSYPYLDDLTVELVPDCPAVDNLTAFNLTGNSADLRWTETGTATSALLPTVLSL